MTGLPKFAASRTLIAAVAALAAVLVVAFGVVALVRPGGDRSEPVATDATTSSPETSPSSPRMSRLAPRSSAPEVTGMLEVSGPACDAPVINSDLLYPNTRQLGYSGPPVATGRGHDCSLEGRRHGCRNGAGCPGAKRLAFRLNR
ncbi:UNVERIFIED_ORG: hypothetical protein EDC92_11811 [Dietzia maris]|uniref:hypothetical protein n=1 Tax=Dietzia maris TaxID=37915 RepID=UPI001051E58E